MEEKILIKGVFSKTNIFTNCFISLGCVLFFILFTFGDSLVDTGIDSLLGYGAIICFIISIVLYCLMNKCEIAVTNKRVYGKAAFGKRVDLPLDMISSVAMCTPKGVSVATSSGKISFLCCKNRNEVFDTISKLLIERQEDKKQKETVIKQEIHQSNADELKKFKDLLDSGVITQEEFDAKKKQLLGL